MAPGLRGLVVKLKKTDDGARLQGADGPASLSATAAAAASAALNAASAGGAVKITMAVPKRRCGQLVAGAGMFKLLQQTFGVKLKIPRATDPDGTPMVIEGSVGCVDACIEEIQKLCHNECEIVTREQA